MLRAPFAEQLRTCETTNTSLVCVGLDPLPDMMPTGFDGADGRARILSQDRRCDG